MNKEELPIDTLTSEAENTLRLLLSHLKSEGKTVYNIGQARKTPLDLSEAEKIQGFVGMPIGKQPKNMDYTIWKKEFLEDQSHYHEIFMDDRLKRPFPISYGFDSVAIKQKFNVCSSRLDVNIESEVIRGIKLAVPLMSANMSTVTNAEFALQMWGWGGLGVLHRAQSRHNQIKEVCKLKVYGCPWIAVSVGTSQEDYNNLPELVRAGANIVFIDIAHGYCEAVLDMAKYIKSNFNVKVVAGNTTNPDMIGYMSEYCDAVKVGIGQGLACLTASTAACTAGQFSAVYECSQQAKKYGIPIISDGGIRNEGHFSKAVAAGASSCMAGSIFARCPESAAETIETENGPMKVYSGMASRAVANEWKGQLKPGTCPEGKTMLLPLGESLEALMERYSGALKSCVTYSGGSDIQTLHENVEFMELR
jgi:IMP dehydrogenase